VQPNLQIFYNRAELLLTVLTALKEDILAVLLDYVDTVPLSKINIMKN